MLAGIHGGSATGDLLVSPPQPSIATDRSDGALPPRYDPFAFTLVEMLVAFTGLALAAISTAAVPRGWTVWAHSS